MYIDTHTHTHINVTISNTVHRQKYFNSGNEGNDKRKVVACIKLEN